MGLAFLKREMSDEFFSSIINVQLEFVEFVLNIGEVFCWLSSAKHLNTNRSFSRVFFACVGCDWLVVTMWHLVYRQS